MIPTNIPKTRIVSIDILKMIAVLFVLNSHAELCYGDYSVLATGGAIGDALFFFCSGFMLFRGPTLRFDNFMKRRFARIYPTVFCVAIIATLFFGRSRNIVNIILHGGGWFVSCILLYYPLLWLIKRFMLHRLRAVWAVAVSVVLLWFYFLFDYQGEYCLYGDNYFKWCFFFLFMLQGAVMGMHAERYKYNRWVIPKLLSCICAWYAFFILDVYFPKIANVQYFSIIPLGGGNLLFLYILLCQMVGTTVCSSYLGADSVCRGRSLLGMLSDARLSVYRQAQPVVPVQHSHYLHVDLVRILHGQFCFCGVCADVQDGRLRVEKMLLT